MRFPVALLASLLAPLAPSASAAPSATSPASPPPASPSAPMRPYGLVLHGGAGVITRAEFSAAREAEYRAKLEEALNAGYAVLDRGGAALDAVTATINVLEDSPLFNAGTGAVLNAAGVCELDASIMDGRTRAAGGVAGVHHIKNPIDLARDVMTKSPHVLLAGEGAEQFARELGYAMLPPSYFVTPLRQQQLERARAADRKETRRRAAAGLPPIPGFATVEENDPLTRGHRYGTVGCVALDQAGNLAAGTSTGGLTNKKFGRIGDSPLIGAGTYADNATCGVSSTGTGEFFIRAVVACDIAARMRYLGASVADAAAAAIEAVGRLGGTGGVIALDREGRVAMPFNTPGMYRAVRLSSGRREIDIFAAPSSR